MKTFFITRLLSVISKEQFAKYVQISLTQLRNPLQSINMFVAECGIILVNFRRPVIAFLS